MVLGVEVADEAWGLLTHPLWTQLAARPVDLCLSDRLPVNRDGRTAVSDADGRLTPLLRPACGRFVLVRPDRFIAAVFEPSGADLAADRLTALAGGPDDITLGRLA